MSLKDKIESLINVVFSEIVGIRKYLHQHPELSFEEYNTSKYICSKLDSIGVDYEVGVVETGVVATIKGLEPHTRCIALRADMDALPIQELNDVDYASKHQGLMHACGHDVHTACLLGAAMVLKELKNEFRGTVKMIFQPGEEQLPGGASLMIKEGVLQNPKVEKIIALHVYPNLEAGKVGFKTGKYMAACDELFLEIEGKGGHAALLSSSENPIMVMAELLPKLETYVQRFSNEHNDYVFAIGKVMAMGATNVIPKVLKAEGTFRTMDEDWRFKLHEKMMNFVAEFIESRGMRGGLRIKKGYPNLYNDPKFTEAVRANAIDYLGAGNVVDLNKRMTAEDFAFYSQQIPACFFRLGVRNEAKGIVHGVHHPKFDADEKSLAIGSAILAYAALKELT